ncbi:hypothetical protein SprV_0100467600 [Sparganum proliferum]
MSPHPDQRHLPSSNAREGHLAAPSVATLAPDGLCPNTEARPAGRTDDEDDLGNELTQRPANLPVPAAAVAADNENVSVEKRWYRRHRSTTDIIFAARQLGKKCPEMRIHLYSTLVYGTKVFDTVNREGLWKIMQRFGCPERFNTILRQHHDRMTTRVTDNGAVPGHSQ